jgi:hypothetical protein
VARICKGIVIVAATVRRRRFAWTILLLALAALGVLLYFLLPPAPRWRLDGCGAVDFTLADRPMFLTWPNATSQWLGPAILRDLDTGEPIRTFFAEIEHARWVVLSPNGRWIACTDADTGALHVAAVADGTERRIAFHPADSVQFIHVAPDGALVAVRLRCVKGGRNHYRLALFETDTGKQLAEVPGALLDAQFVLDGALLVVSVHDGDDNLVKGWDICNRRWAPELDDSDPSIWRVHAIGPDGRTLVAEHAASSKEPRWTVWDMQLLSPAIVGPAGSRLLGVSFASNGRRTAITHGKKHEWHVDVWDAGTQQRVCHFDTDSRSDVVLSPDGKRLALQATIYGDDPVRTLTILDVDTGRRVTEHRAAAHMFWAEPAPAFGPDGRSVVLYRGWHEPLHADILDTNTGALLASLPLAPTDAWADASVTVAPDRRSHAVQVTYSSVPAAWWHEWVPQPLRPPSNGFADLIIIDVDRGHVTARKRLADSEQAVVLDGGRLLMTYLRDADNNGEPGYICCWDLPQRTAWHWVIGIPAALGLMVVGAAIVRRWRRGSTAS